MIFGPQQLTGPHELVSMFHLSQCLQLRATACCLCDLGLWPSGFLEPESASAPPHRPGLGAACPVPAPSVWQSFRHTLCSPSRRPHGPHVTAPGLWQPRHETRRTPHNGCCSALGVGGGKGPEVRRRNATSPGTAALGDALPGTRHCPADRSTPQTHWAVSDTPAGTRRPIPAEGGLFHQWQQTCPQRPPPGVSSSSSGRPPGASGECRGCLPSKAGAGAGRQRGPPCTGPLGIPDACREPHCVSLVWASTAWGLVFPRSRERGQAGPPCPPQQSPSRPHCESAASTLPPCALIYEGPDIHGQFVIGRTALL